jgi:hypothetical protein
LLTIVVVVVEVFFEMTFTFALGPIPMVVFIEGVGGAGMYWSIGTLSMLLNCFSLSLLTLLCALYILDMIFAPALKDKYGNECGGIDDGGGSMINGFCEVPFFCSVLFYASSERGCDGDRA